MTHVTCYGGNVEVGYQRVPEQQCVVTSWSVQFSQGSIKQHYSFIQAVVIFAYIFCIIYLQCLYDINLFTFHIIKQHYSFIVRVAQ